MKIAFRDRLRRYYVAHLEAGLTYNEEYCHYPGQRNGQPASTALTTLMHLGSPPTAIFCSNDKTAFNVLKCCHEIGVTVPDTLSVVGFDDSEYAEFSNPSLTTIRQRTLEAGEVAMVELLTSILTEDYVPKRILLETDLILRSSTARPQLRDGREASIAGGRRRRFGFLVSLPVASRAPSVAVRQVGHVARQDLHSML